MSHTWKRTDRLPDGWIPAPLGGEVWCYECSHCAVPAVALRDGVSEPPAAPTHPTTRFDWTDCDACAVAMVQAS